MTEDTTRVLEELRGIVNSFVIRGSGVAGNIRNGYTINPGSGQISSGSGGTPPVEISGACCPQGGDCFIATESVCDYIGGLYQGDDTTCDPDPCPTTDTGACCRDAYCSIRTEADCISIGGTYGGDGSDCGPPNPCFSGCSNCGGIFPFLDPDSGLCWTGFGVSGFHGEIVDCLQAFLTQITTCAPCDPIIETFNPDTCADTQVGDCLGCDVTDNELFDPSIPCP